jgi:hypothetical protein
VLRGAESGLFTFGVEIWSQEGGSGLTADGNEALTRSRKALLGRAV